jgi:hypothetical protein
MNQPHLSALGFSPKADLTLSLTSGEAGELMKILKPLAVMPEKHDDYPAARLAFVIYGRLRKLASEAAKVAALLIVFFWVFSDQPMRRGFPPSRGYVTNYEA